jgi:hypothetical protein
METQDKLSNTDHDALIELKTEFKAFVRQYSLDIKELKDGTQKTLIDHDLAIKKNHEEHILLREEQDRLSNKIKAQEARWRAVISLLAPIYIGIVGFILAKVFDLFK